MMPKILIVDDDRTTRALLRAWVMQTSFEVLLAEDGQEAWEILQEKKFDLVVTDCEMPNMNGIELTKKIRADQNTKQLLVVMITSRNSPRDKVTAKTAGVDIFLTKPLKRDNFLGTIQNLLTKG